jgi:pentalenolactone synthase
VVQIGLGAMLLLTNRDQWRALVDDPALIPNAVEELLRATAGAGPVGGVPRYARTDFDIDGVAIRAGDLVLLDVAAANHDPAMFPDPQRFDVARKEAAHLTFGHGARYCIGAPLARIELKTVFGQLIPRFPSMRLTVDPATLPTRPDVLAGGLAELPVSW